MGKRYSITTTVTFTYESEIDQFDSQSQAEEFAWDYDNLWYDCVDSIEVDEIETCDDCSADIYECECEKEGE